jgi:hypothetical protein
MIEIIKPIDNFTDYQISNYGYVISIKSKITLKHNFDKRGYPCIYLYDKGIRHFFRLHRLVALNFIHNDFNKSQVNHIDGNKQNNRADNLEWVTCQENIIHANENGLFEIKNKKISQRMKLFMQGKSFNHKNVLDTMTGIFYDSLAQACKTYNLSYSTEVKRTRKEKNNRFIYI